MKPMTGLRVRAAASLLAVAGLAAADAAQLVSVPADSGLTGNSGSYAPLLSPDGRRLVFVSWAKNLATNDGLAPFQNLFLKDLAADRLTLVSVSTNGVGGGDGPSGYPAFSADGRFVVFTSSARNLAARDTNDTVDVFVRSTAGGTATVASVSLNGWAGGRCRNGALISSNGNRVVFTSSAENLSTNAYTPQATEVYLRDLAEGVTRLVSASPNNMPHSGQINLSEAMDMTPDGRYVAFASTVPDLTPWLSLGSTSLEMYVRDMETGRFYWVSTNLPSPLAQGGLRFASASLSADGRFVFMLASGSSSIQALLRHDRQTGATILITAGAEGMAGRPSITADGRFAVFTDAANVWLWDGQTGSNQLVSVNRFGGMPATGVSRSPQLTPDGRTVVFVSSARDLVEEGSADLFQVYARDLQSGITRLVTTRADGRPSTSDHAAVVPSVSDDGLRVAFDSGDDGLVPGDLNRTSDVFIRDLPSASPALVSRRAPGANPGTARTWSAAGGLSSLSADGRWLVFTAPDNNLTPGDTNRCLDVFLRDLATATTRRLTRATNSSHQPVLSADGRFAAFVESAPWSPVPGTGGDILRLKLETDEAEMANLRHDNTIRANWPCHGPLLSPDGRHVAFLSKASDLVSDATGAINTSNLFVRDMVLRTNWLVTRGMSGGYADGVVPFYRFSPDGKWLLFASTSQALPGPHAGGPDLYLHDLGSRSNRPVSVQGTAGLGVKREACFSGDSRWVAFSSSYSEIWMHDALHGTNRLVNAPGLDPALNADGSVIVCHQPLDTYLGAGTNLLLMDLARGTNCTIGPLLLSEGPVKPQITPDGRRILLRSASYHLAPDNTNRVPQLFLWDANGSTFLNLTASTLKPGIANGPHTRPWLSGDGKTIVFGSFASDLVPADWNAERDVFAARLEGGDSEADGMDDDWEMAWFGSLSRTGGDDADGDGVSDLDECRSGTSPVQGASVLRAVVLRSGDGAAVNLLWPAVAGRSYKVEYRDTVEGPAWTELPGDPVVADSTAWQTDASAVPGLARFYRVVVRQ